ncbi:MAG: rubredoxin [Methanospirillum sp.]|uniref:rubredoxin n=1 Tax=Methanospirillum sp. TaxID=45200 RepID=UPI00236B7A12|nr:rubredoxin [Methanospirillum sp.]MDD1728652.1 rubredoxin [Methanospirillum sp.]
MLMAEWICTKCGYIYNEAFGDVAHDIPKNTPFEKIDPSWICPRCGADKSFFVKKS